jgi:hypothetical protein
MADASSAETVIRTGADTVSRKACRQDEAVPADGRPDLVDGGGDGLGGRATGGAFDAVLVQHGDPEVRADPDRQAGEHARGDAERNTGVAHRTQHHDDGGGGRDDADEHATDTYGHHEQRTDREERRRDRSQLVAHDRGHRCKRGRQVTAVVRPYAERRGERRQVLVETRGATARS